MLISDYLKRGMKEFVLCSECISQYQDFKQDKIAVKIDIGNNRGIWQYSFAGIDLIDRKDFNIKYSKCIIHNGSI